MLVEAIIAANFLIGFEIHFSEVPLGTNMLISDLDLNEFCSVVSMDEINNYNSMLILQKVKTKGTLIPFNQPLHFDCGKKTRPREVK